MRCSSIFQVTPEWQSVAVYWSVMLGARRVCPKPNAARLGAIEKEPSVAIEFLRTSQWKDGQGPTTIRSPGMYRGLVTAAVLQSGAKSKIPWAEGPDVPANFCGDDGGQYTTTGNHGTTKPGICLGCQPQQVRRLDKLSRRARLPPSS